MTIQDLTVLEELEAEVPGVLAWARESELHPVRAEESK